MKITPTVFVMVVIIAVGVGILLGVLPSYCGSHIYYPGMKLILPICALVATLATLVLVLCYHGENSTFYWPNP